MKYWTAYFSEFVGFCIIVFLRISGQIWALLFGDSYCCTYKKQNLQLTYLNLNVIFIQPKYFLSLPQEG